MAKRYIDADLLRKEIERLNNLNKQIAKEQGPTDFIKGITAGYAEVLSSIDSLQQELVEVKVKPLMGYHKSCGFVATEIELQGYGVLCENGEGKIYTEK